MKSTWVEPTVSCAGIGEYAVFWVGLDGWNSGTVEQGGSEARCFGTTPVYSLWWEMYPTNNIQDMTGISAGDTITASVTSDSATGNYTIVVADQTAGTGFTEVQQCTGTCSRSSAEVIAEEPSCGGNCYYPLADYGNVQFRNSSVTDSNGVTGTFNQSAWQNIQVQEQNGTLASATTSGLTADGGGFGVTWNPTIVPGAVSGLQAGYNTSTKLVALSWTNPGGAVSGDVVRRSAAGAGCPTTTSAGSAVGDSSLRTSQTDSGLASGSYCYAVFAQDSIGSSPVQTVSVTVPTVNTGTPGPLTAQIQAPAVMSADANPTVVYALSWTAGSCGSKPTYTVTESANGATAIPVFSGAALTASLNLPVGSHYVFAVNCGGPATATTFSVAGFQQTSAKFTGTWTASTFAGAWAGTASYSTAKNASASFTCTCEAIAWVTDEDANHGKAKVYIDGVLKTTVNTNPQLRRIAWWCTSSAGPLTAPIRSRS